MEWKKYPESKPKDMAFCIVRHEGKLGWIGLAQFWNMGDFESRFEIMCAPIFSPPVHVTHFIEIPNFK